MVEGSMERPAIEAAVAAVRYHMKAEDWALAERKKNPWESQFCAFMIVRYEDKYGSNPTQQAMCALADCLRADYREDLVETSQSSVSKALKALRNHLGSSNEKMPFC